MSAAVLAAGVIVLLGPAGFGVASSSEAGATGCSQLNRIPGVFPAAKTVGFIKRNAVKPTPARQPIWPGWCGRTWWSTAYTGRKGAVEVSVALYATSQDVDAALLEPAYGGKPMRQSNGARVVTNDLAGNKSVGSAYRNIWISSTSIDVPERTVSVAAQLRLHRDRVALQLVALRRLAQGDRTSRNSGPPERASVPANH